MCQEMTYEETQELLTRCLSTASPNTKSIYSSEVLRLCRYYQSEFLDLTDDQIRDYYLVHLNKRITGGDATHTRLNPASARVAYFAVKRLYDELHAEDSPLFKTEILAIEDAGVAIDELPTRSDFSAFLTALQDLCTNNPPFFSSLSLACHLAFYCGLRKSEIFALQAGDFISIDSLYGHLSVASDTSAERHIYMPSELVPVVKAHLRLYGTNTSSLLLNRRGKPLTGSVCEKQLRRAAEACGIPKRFHLQAMRSACILRCNGPGCDYDAIMNYFGVKKEFLYRLRCIQKNQEEWNAI